MTIPIEQWRFLKTFGSDGDYDSYSQYEEVYLSVTSGELIDVAIDPTMIALNYGEEMAEEMLFNQTVVEAKPDKFLLIPSMSHGQQHDVIQDFLASNWTPDTSRKDQASGAYYQRRSIGFWLREVNDSQAIDAYFRFKEVAILQRAEAFLRANGITEFLWV